MTYYKIKNLTASLPKRHIHKNETLSIEYKTGFSSKTHKLAPNAIIYVSAPSLPASLHKLRMKSLISVVEISKNEFLKLQNPVKEKSDIQIVKKKPIETTTTTKKKRTSRKKSSTKKTITKEDSTLILKDEKEEESKDL